MNWKGGGVEPTRYYHCCHCGGWHYTAIPYSNVFVFFGCFWFKRPETGASIGMQIFFNQHAVNARMVVGERLLYQRMFHCAGGFAQIGQAMRDMIARALRDFDEAKMIADALYWYWRVVNQDASEFEKSKNSGRFADALKIKVKAKRKRKHKAKKNTGPLVHSTGF